MRRPLIFGDPAPEPVTNVTTKRSLPIAGLYFGVVLRFRHDIRAMRTTKAMAL